MRDPITIRRVGQAATVLDKILGALYILTGSLWAPILVHFVINLNSGVLMRRVTQELGGRGASSCEWR